MGETLRSFAWSKGWRVTLPLATSSARAPEAWALSRVSPQLRGASSVSSFPWVSSPAGVCGDGASCLAFQRAVQAVWPFAVHPISLAPDMQDFHLVFQAPVRS